ncbi:hypothetical protein DYQ86_11435 [Acidobacteria bacterium AB60]|nr:hypothetical protein DYQ86_11435 [Acidobacteria bacterium AB60]
MDTIQWLLDSDPALRWQAMRDLTDAPPAEIAAQRGRIAHEGLGAAILKTQDADGAWRKKGARAWRTTLFTLQLLRATGVDPSDPAVHAALALPSTNLRWNDNGEGWNLRPAQTGGNPFFEGEEEPCINGGVLAFGSYFGHPSANLARRLLGEQLEDGGWNCEAPPSSRSSYHTTLCVLEGLLEYEKATGGAPEIAAAREKGEEYLLRRGLFRRLSTGEIASQDFLQFAFPVEYHYDLLRALEYFHAARRRDSRMSHAISLIESRRRDDGSWALDRTSDVPAIAPPDETEGTPSRWTTLRALRVLRWYAAA